MIFSLNPLSFALSHPHIEALKTANLDRLVPDLLLLGYWGHTAPLAAGYLDQLIKEDLVILINCYIPLISEEFLGLFPLVPIPFHHSRHILRILYGLVRHRNLIYLLLVNV